MLRSLKTPIQNLLGVIALAAFFAIPVWSQNLAEMHWHVLGAGAVLIVSGVCIVIAENVL